MSKLNLAENSISYLENAPIYETFSAAQDKPDYIGKFLQTKVSEKIVLDVGCGTGKFVRRLSRFSKKYFAFDISSHQIEIAKKKTKSQKVKFICSCALSIPLKSESVDVAIATWVFGTINSYARKKQALEEVLRVLKPGGRVFFVENDIGEEFETIRNRFPNTRRTTRYNNWILRQGFSVAKQFTTSFHFDSTREAKNVFEKIWGSKVSRRIASKQIAQKVIIFEKSK